MADSSAKKEIRDFFKALSDYEDGVMAYVRQESTSVISVSSFLLSKTMSALKGEVLAQMSSKASFAEAYNLDAIFRFDATTRDLAIRKKTRKDYYTDSSTEQSYEKIRLVSKSTAHLQYYSGNTKIQGGAGA